METIRSLSEIDHDDIYDAFNEAFIDYSRTWTKLEFEKMIFRRGYNSHLSFGAFIENKLVSFTLNATGNFNEKNTAYDTATGTLKEHRGKGLATKIFNYSLPFLKQNGIQQYLLEVITDNTQAISVYSKLDFKVTRELNYFVKNKNELKLNSKNIPENIELKEIDLTLKDEMMAMWEFYPAWQNSFDCIERKIGDFKIIGAFNKEKLIGYGITEIFSGDIPQLAICKTERRKGIGSALLKELIKRNTGTTVRIINTDKTCENLNSFIKNNQIPKLGAQYEMIKDLNVI